MKYQAPRLLTFINSQKRRPDQSPRNPSSPTIKRDLDQVAKDDFSEILLLRSRRNFVKVFRSPSLPEQDDCDLIPRRSGNPVEFLPSEITPKPKWAKRRRDQFNTRNLFRWEEELLGLHFLLFSIYPAETCEPFCILTRWMLRWTMRMIVSSTQIIQQFSGERQFINREPHNKPHHGQQQILFMALPWIEAGISRVVSSGFEELGSLEVLFAVQLKSRRESTLAIRLNENAIEIGMGL